MLVAFLTTLAQMCRILFFLIVGYMFNKLHLVPRTAEPVLSKFVALLFIPSLTFYSNLVECNLTSLGQYSQWVLIGGALWLGCTLIGAATTRFFGGDNAYLRGVYRYAFGFPNTGAVGTPLILSLFGTAGLFKYGLFTFINGVMTYAWGVQQMQPQKEKMTLRVFLKNFFNLNFIAMISGMLLGLLGGKEWMPEFALKIFSDLGGCYVPVALLLTGFSIADYSFSEVFGNVKIYLYTAMRLLILPGLVLMVLYAFQAPYMLAVMAALVYACPCGMNVVVFPASYGQECKDGASMVLISSMCSIITVPLIYALVQQFFA